MTRPLVAIALDGQRASREPSRVEPHHTLLDVLRDDLGLTGTKECCLVGECGACTVLLDGRSVDACLVLAVEADGGDVVDGRGAGAATGGLGALQAAFLDTGAAQCGFCIPGQLMSAQALLARRAAPDPRRDRGGARRQPLPLRRLRADHRGRAAGGRRDGAAHAGLHAARRPPAASTSPPARRRAGAAVSGDAGDRRVGDSPWRVGGRDRVTGRQAYVADLRARGRAPRQARHRRRRPGADRLASTPTRALAAARRPAGLDAPPTCRSRCRASGRSSATGRCSPIGETNYHGEPVAAVAAETAGRSPRRPPRWSRVEYEPLPAVVTLEAALAPGAPLVQDPSLRPDDPLAEHQRPARARASAGATSRPPSASADVVVEGTYDLPDGHPVRDRAARLHGRARTATGSPSGARSSTPTGCSASSPRCSACRSPRSASSRPDPGGAFGGKQHAKYEPLLAFMALRAGRPVRLVLTLEETFQAVRRGASEIRVRTGFHRDGTLAFRDIDADYLIGAYADIADRVVAQGQLHRRTGRTGPRPSGSVARSVLSHTVPSTAFRGFGNPQQIWAVESNIDEAARPARHRPARAAAAQPRPSRRRVHPRRHAGGRRLGRDGAAGRRRAIGWGIAAAAGPRPGHRGRAQVGADDRPLVLDRPAAGRRQRRRTAGHLGHGPGRAHDLRPDRGPGAGRAARLGHGRHAATPPSCPYDQQTSASRSSVLMGNAVLLACRDVQAKLARDGRAARGGRRRTRSTVDRGRGADRRPGVADPRRARPAASAGSAARSSASARCARRRSRSTRSAARPRSTSSTARPSRCRSTEETGDVTVHRHVTVSDVGRGAPPGPGPRPGRGRRDHGPGPHADGALPVRRARAGSGTWARSTTGSRPRWTCRSRWRARSSRTATGPGPYGAKGMSEGALLCVAPAVAAAVRDATGAVIRDLPLSPERVWRALQELDADDAEGPSQPRPGDDSDVRARLPVRARPTRSGRCSAARRRTSRVMLGPDLGLPVPPGFVDHHRRLPRVPRRAAGPTGLDAELRRADGRASRRRRAAGSATRPTRCWSASGPARRSRCPG